MSDLDLTVLLPSIPERRELAREALGSVLLQGVPLRYLTALDANHNGPAATVNALAACVETEWLFRLDDDDLVDPDHFEVLSHFLDDGADIVYTWCRIEGGGELHPENQFQVRLQNAYGWEHLHEVNWIPCSAAIRTDLWHDLGGYRDVAEEDWDFWKRALDAGARFRCVPTVTWTYRMNREWPHRSDTPVCRGWAESDLEHAAHG